ADGAAACRAAHADPVRAGPDQPRPVRSAEQALAANRCPAVAVAPNSNPRQPVGQSKPDRPPDRLAVRLAAGAPRRPADRSGAGATAEQVEEPAEIHLGEAAERSGPRGQGPAAWAEPAVRSGPLLPPPAQSAAALLRLAVYRGRGQAAAGRLSEPGRAGLPRVFELFNRELEPRVAAGGHHRPADFAAPGEFRQLLSRLPRLAELALPYSNINNSMAELLIHPLHGGGIHGLRLDFCTQLTADRFGRLAAACPRLRSLCIGECRVLDGAAYRLLVDRLPAGVEELRIVRFTRCRLADADLAAPLPVGLRQLCLRICPLLELEDFAGLGLSEGLRACQGLTHLTLDVCHDDRLPALLVQLPRLRCLRLLDCRRLTGRAWANLRTVQNCSADLLELRVLLYPEADREPYKSEPSLTDEAIADLCASPVARGLRRLWLSGCTQLTPAALASIRNGCPWLQQLVIAGCDALTEAAVAAFQSAYEQPVLVASGSDAKELILDAYLTLMEPEV
ncbi:hypothetical protein BOX15_Mlig026428g1, partial [Macrostomum lignano]